MVLQLLLARFNDGSEMVFPVSVAGFQICKLDLCLVEGGAKGGNGLNDMRVLVSVHRYIRTRALLFAIPRSLNH